MSIGYNPINPYKSTDTGETWTPTGSFTSQTGQQVAISVSGQTQIISINNLGTNYKAAIKLSTNYGSTWSTPYSVDDKFITGLGIVNSGDEIIFNVHSSISPNPAKMFRILNLNTPTPSSQQKISTTGLNLVHLTNDLAGVSVSGDGNIIFVGVINYNSKNGKNLYYSYNNGLSWIKSTINKNPNDSGLPLFMSINSSLNGKYILTCSGDINNEGSLASPSSIYISTDYGQNYTYLDFPFGHKRWCNVCVSITGKFMAAVGIKNSSTIESYYVYSNDYGQSWTYKIDYDNTYYSIAMS